MEIKYLVKYLATLGCATLGCANAAMFSMCTYGSVRSYLLLNFLISMKAQQEVAHLRSRCSRWPGSASSGLGQTLVNPVSEGVQQLERVQAQAGSWCFSERPGLEGEIILKPSLLLSSCS